ncbi:MAG: LysM peptidoglycan-binding domain-containing protein [Rickettsiaceae bacterium]|nr:MAG: LysM peptidoglycan-binding domain-containing protein [Rickettsiaceae bacterium]
MTKVFTVIIILLLVSSCANQQPAPIEFNEAGVNNPNNSKVIVVRKKLVTKTINISENKNIILEPLSAKDEYKEITTNTVIIPKQKKIEAKSIDNQDNYQETRGKLKEPQSLQQELLPPQPQKLKIIYHEARTGETLTNIAQDYSTSLEKIIELNQDLTADTNLMDMQIIKVPVTSNILNKKNRENSETYKEKYKKNSTIEINADAILIDKTKYINPLQGTIIASFDELIDHNKNAGINIAAEKGTAVMSIADGAVVKVGSSPKYGNLIIIKSNNTNLNIAYAHLDNITLKIGQKITQGEIIGVVGDSGNIDKPQLYIAIKDGDKAVDPLLYIPGF